jgi:hypothetical protein
MAEPPYGEIWDLLKAGRVIPFLGAGASLGGSREGKWNPDLPAFMPSGVDLAHFLADRARFPSRNPLDLDDLAKVASYYADMSGRGRLRERLRAVLARDFPVGPLHQMLAAVPAPQVIVATNYDTLLEQAFRAAERPYDLVIYPTDRKDIANSVLWWPHGATEPKVHTARDLDIDLSKTTVIYKMHGTVMRDTDRWDSFVITEEDYVDFLYRMTNDSAVPALFYEHFRDRSFLFLGYSLRDWNLRVVLKSIKKVLPSWAGPGTPGDEEDVPQSWAIQRGPSELEQALWLKRGVHIFDVPLDDFVANLRNEMTR